MTGSTTGAKATGGEIGCDAAGTFVWCNAKDAAGNVAGCWSLANAQFVNPMGSTDHCMIMFTFDDTGKCTGLVTRNGSNYLPDPPE